MRKYQSRLIVITSALAISIASYGGGGGGKNGGSNPISWGDWVYEPVSYSLVRTEDINGDGASDILAAGYRFRTRSSCIDPALVDCKEEQEIQEVVNLHIQDTLNPGNFLAADVYPLSFQARDLAVGDLDADGIPDLTIAEQARLRCKPFNCRGGSKAYVEIFSRYSFGSGGFLFHGRYKAKRKLPNCIAIGDLNADGLQDVAVGAFESLRLMMNRPASPGQSFKLRSLGDTTVANIAIADINNDDLDDIVVTRPRNLKSANSRIAIAVYLQDQSRRSGKYSRSGTYDVAFDPLFNSGVNEIGSAAYDPANEPLFNNGAIPFDIALADLNNDSLPDLVVAARDYQGSKSVGAVSVRLQDPMNIGEYLAPEFYIGYLVLNSVAIGDLNNDLLPDIAIGHASGIEILFQGPQTSGKFLLPSATYSGMGGEIELADMNGDDLTDIVGTSSGNLYIRYQDPSNPGVFSEPMLLP